MQELARLGKFYVQNFLSAPTEVFEKCGVQSTPLPEIKIVREVKNLGLNWSRVPPLPMQGTRVLVCGD